MDKHLSGINMVALTTRMQRIVARAKSSWAVPFRKDAVAILFLLCVIVASWLPRLRGPIDLRWDGGVYYILGTSLAEGKGYRLLNEPGEIEAIQYPPLLPLMVAAHQRLLGTSDPLVVAPWLRIFYFFLSICFTVAVYLLARFYLSPGFALLATLVCVVYFFFYYWSEWLYAEIPFGLATVLFALCNRKGKGAASDVAAGALAAAAYMLRTSGIALLVAWVAESFLRRRYRQTLLRAGLALIPVLLWQAYIARAQNSQQYKQPVYAYQRAPYQYSNVSYAENVLLIDPFKPELGRITAIGLLRRAGGNLMAMPRALGETVSSPASFCQVQAATLFSLLGLKRRLLYRPIVIPLSMLGLLVTGGMVLLWIRQEWFIPLYFSAYVLVTCVTPWPEQFSRYLLPLGPFLALSLFHLLAWVGRQGTGWRGRIGPAIVILLPAVILFAQGLTLTQAYLGGRRAVTYHDANGNGIKHLLFYYDTRWESVNAALEWLRRRAQPGEVIAATAPHSAYLRTGLKAVLPPLEADGEQAQRLLDSAAVKYVVLDTLEIPGISERYAAPTIEKHPRLWRLVYDAPGGGARIYERVQ